MLVTLFASATLADEVSSAGVFRLMESGFTLIGEVSPIGVFGVILRRQRGLIDV